MPRLDPDATPGQQPAPSQQPAPAPTPQQQHQMREQQRNDPGPTQNARSQTSPGVNMLAVVPSTGESFGNWIARRVESLAVAHNLLPAQDILHIASSPIADQHLAPLAEHIANHADLLPQASASGPQPSGGFTGPQPSGGVSGPQPVGVPVTAKEAAATGISRPGTWAPSFAGIQGAQAMAELKKNPESVSPWEGLKGVGSSVLEDLGVPYHVLLEPYVGFAGQYVGTEERKLALSTVGLPDDLAQKVLKERGLAPRPDSQIERELGLDKGFPSLSTAWHNAMTRGAGVNYADAIGAPPGSKEAQVAAGAFDFLTRWYLDPLNLVAKASEGIKLAQKIPLLLDATKVAERAGVAVEEVANLPGVLKVVDGVAHLRPTEGGFIARSVQNLMAKTPQEIMQLPSSVKAVEKIGEQLDSGRTVVDVADRFRLSYPLAQSLKYAETDAERLKIIEGALDHGEIPHIPQAERAGRLAEISAKLEAGDLAASAEKDLQREKSYLESLDNAPLKREFYLHEAPRATMLGALRQAIKRGGEGPFAKLANKLFGNPWMQGPFRQTYRRGISFNLADKDVAIQELQRFGEVLKLPREVIDRHLEEMVQGGALNYNVVTSLLKEARTKLNDVLPGAGDHLVKFSDSTGGDLFNIDAVSGDRGYFAYKEVRPGVRIKVYQPQLSSEKATGMILPDPEPIRQLLSLRGKIRREYLTARNFFSDAAEQAGNTALELAKRGGGDVETDEEALRLALGEKFRSSGEFPNLDAAPNARAARLAAARRMTAEQVASPSVVAKFVTRLTNAWKASVIARVGTGIKQVLEGNVRRMAMDLAQHHVFPYQDLIDQGGGVIAMMSEDDLAKALGDRAMEVTRQRGDRQIVALNEEGHDYGWQNELVSLNRAQEARAIIAHGHGGAAHWLNTDEMGMQIWKDHQRVAEAVHGVTGEAAQRAWLDSIEHRINQFAPTKELKQLILEGYMPGIDKEIGWVGNDYVRNYLKSLPDEIKPPRVRNLSQSWEAVDTSAIRELQSNLIKRLLVTPYSKFVKQPAMEQLFKQRFAEVMQRTNDAELAAQVASRYAADRMVQVFDHVGQRSAFEESVKNLMPFLPAHRRFLTAWLSHIPNQYGYGLGYIYELRRAQQIWQFGTETGLIHKDPTGAWMVHIPGVTDLLRNTLHVGGEIKGSAIADWVTGLPLGGPAAIPGLVGAKYLVDGHPAAQQILASALPYGPGSIVPSFMNYFARGLFGTVPWKPMSKLAQDHSFYLAQVDYLRAHYKQMQAIFGYKTNAYKDALKLPQDQQADALKAIDATFHQRLTGFLDQSRRAAASAFMIRGLLGFVMPYPIDYNSPQATARNAFFQKLNALPKDQQPAAYADYLAQHPDMELWLTGATHAIQGEQQQTKALDGEWNAWTTSHRQDYSLNEWAMIQGGYVSYRAARNDRQRAWADIGPTASDWAAKPFEYEQAQARYYQELDILRQANPDWAKAYDQAIANKQAAPTTFAEDQYRKAFDSLAQLKLLDQGKPDSQVDWKQLGILSSQIRNEFALGTSAGGATGEQKVWGNYWANHVDPYLQKISAIYKDIKWANPDDQAAGYLAIQQLKESQKPVIVDGEQFPSVEEFLFNRKSPQDQALTKAKWAFQPVEWRTTFERGALGIPTHALSKDFWDAVVQVNGQLAKWKRENPGASTTERSDANAAVQLAIEAAANKAGVADEWKFAQMRPFQRIYALKATAGDYNAQSQTWDRLMQVAQDFLTSFGKASGYPGAPADRASMTQKMYGVIDLLRQNDPLFEQEMRAEQGLVRSPDQGNRQFFYNDLLGIGVPAHALSTTYRAG